MSTATKNKSYLFGENTIYLYVKQHTVTGLKYFGMTKTKDPFKYKGSGTYWFNHCAKYGKEHIKTLEIWSFDNQEDCTAFALKFSEDNDIVKAKDSFGFKIWANMRPENGSDGLPAGYNGHFSTERRKQHSERWTGDKNPNHLPHVKQQHSERWAGDKNPSKKQENRLKASKRAKAKKGIPTRPCLDETKNKISNSLTGRKRKEESTEKQILTRKENPWCWVVNDNAEFYILRKDIENYLNLGFKEGRKQIIHSKPRPAYSEEYKKNQRIIQKDFRWVHNKIDSPLRIKIEFFDYYIKNGYYKGRGPKKNW